MSKNRKTNENPDTAGNDTDTLPETQDETQTENTETSHSAGNDAENTETDRQQTADGRRQKIRCQRCGLLTPIS